MKRSIFAKAIAASFLFGAVMFMFSAPATASPTLERETVAASENVENRSVNLRTPFDCGEVWNANTRANHSPQLAVDFQRSPALGQNTLASAAGTVTVVEDLGGASYGKYVVISHADGWETLYAHLDSYIVSVGDSVSLGQKIGEVGTTGNSTGPHLHYEQKLNGALQHVVLNGVEVAYYGNTTITSSTNC